MSSIRSGRGRVASAVAVAAAAALAVLAHAISASAATAAGALPSARLPSGALQAGALPSPACSWLGETDQRDGNIGAPDLDAFYWMSPLTPNPNTQVQITGSYPSARYFSFHVYDARGDALGSLYDQQITADRGSANPFRRKPPAHRDDRYTVTVKFAAKPAHPAANTLYADPGSMGGAGLLVYRIYVPASTAQPSGDVPYPQVALQTSSGQTLAQLGACSTTPPPFGSVFWEQAAAEDYPAGAPALPDSSATRVPTWQRSFGNQLGNQQNAYLVSDLSRQYGELVVIHAKAPTFPNTRRGQPVYLRHQLRYWSLCTYDSSGEAVLGCAADYNAAIRGGSFTYVISDAGTRPANATPARGVTWLPWGFQSGAQVVYRNMLPASWYTHAVQRVTPSSSVPHVLGAYYPRAVYCPPATFAEGGWRACFKAAGVKP